MKTLLLGMGNPILTDDAVGHRLAEELAPAFADVPGLSVVTDCSVGGLALLDVIAGFDTLIVLDSIRTGLAPAGSWQRFSGEALAATVHLGSAHDANFATALELGRRLGYAVPAPERVHVFAIEVEDDATFGSRLSAPVAAAFERASREIAAELRKLLGEGD